MPGTWWQARGHCGRQGGVESRKTLALAVNGNIGHAEGDQGGARGTRKGDGAVSYFTVVHPLPPRPSRAAHVCGVTGAFGGCGAWSGTSAPRP